MSIEELKNKAEQSWVDCDGCNQDDRQMWINGYLAGALSNQIKLPSDEEIEEGSRNYIKGGDLDTIVERTFFKAGTKWIINHIKQQDK
jgi:hypothetical protein